MGGNQNSHSTPPPSGRALGVILFDGVCNLCNSTVDFVIRHDLERKFQFASLQSNKGQELVKKHKIPKNMETIILVEGEHFYKKSTAIFRILRHLDTPLCVFSFLIILPTFLRDFFYDIIAKNRYSLFGKKETCRVPTTDEKKRFLND